MFSKTKFDISHENFDIFFANHLASITPEAKEKLPRDVAYKLWKGGGNPNAANTTKLNFIAKLWILWKCFRKKIWIIVEDENGLSPEQFCELSAAMKRKRIDQQDLEDGVMDGHFVTANRELCNTLDYLNTQSISPLYNYLMKAKNTPPSKIAEWKEMMNYVTATLVKYERTKKKWMSEYGLLMPEYYVLLACYGGNPTKGSNIYKNIFKTAFQSSQTKVKVAFGTLQGKGYIVKDGEGKGATFRITSLGSELINRMLSKHLIND